MSRFGFHFLILQLCLLVFASCTLTACGNGKEEEFAAALETVQIDQQLYEIRLSLVEERQDQQQARLDGLQNTVEKIMNPLPDAKAATPVKSKPAAPSSVSPPPAAKQPGSKAVSAARQAYDKALSTLLDGNPKSAEAMFTGWLADYPSNALAPNAEYWLGESFYSQARYGEAILAFQNVAASYPKHDKAPAALLKAGYSYERLGDTQNAVFYLQQLLEDYPKSDPAGQAVSALKRLQHD